MQVLRTICERYWNCVLQLSAKFYPKFFPREKMTHIESYLREGARNSRNLALVRNRIRNVGG
jgi:hypothetical protein